MSHESKDAFCQLDRLAVTGLNFKRTQTACLKLLRHHHRRIKMFSTLKVGARQIYIFTSLNKETVNCSVPTGTFDNTQLKS